MPRFHIHLRDGNTFIKDEEGAYFADLEAAKREAEATARDIMLEADRGSSAQSADTVVVTDEKDQYQLAVPVVMH